MNYESACYRFAKRLLRDYRLSSAELDEEAERLARAIQMLVEAELENLDDRVSAW